MTDIIVTITCDFCHKVIEDKDNMITDYDGVMSSGAPNIYREGRVRRDYHEDCYWQKLEREI